MQATLTLPGTEPIVLHLSEAAYRDALALPLPERSRVIALGITAVLAAASETEADNDPDPTEDDLSAIGRGLADLDAGRTVPGDVVFARLREKYGFAKGDNPF